MNANSLSFCISSKFATGRLRDNVAATHGKARLQLNTFNNGRIPSKRLVETVRMRMFGIGPEKLNDSEGA